MRIETATAAELTRSDDMRHGSGAVNASSTGSSPRSVPKTISLKTVLSAQPIFDLEEYRLHRMDFLEFNYYRNEIGWPCPSFRDHAVAPSPKKGAEDKYPEWAASYSCDQKVIDLHYLHCHFRDSLQPNHKLLETLFANANFDRNLADSWARLKLDNKRRVRQLGLSVIQQHMMSVLKTAPVRRRANDIEKELPAVYTAIRRSQRASSDLLGGMSKVEHYTLLYRIFHYVDGSPSGAHMFYPYVTGQDVSSGDSKRFRVIAHERRQRLERWCDQHIDDWSARHFGVNQTTAQHQLWHAQ